MVDLWQSVHENYSMDNQEMEQPIMDGQTDEYLRLMGMLSSHIIHEIGTPLQYVDNNLKFLQQGLKELLELIGDMGDEQAFLLEQLPLALGQSLEGIEQIQQLISALRGFSHQGDGSGQHFSAAEAWKDALLISRGKWKSAVEIQSEIPEMPPIEGNRTLLVQVFLNLLLNSLDALGKMEGENPCITMKMVPKEEGIEISHSDKGCGMDEEQLTHLFTPFYTTKPRGEGSGQGLSFIKMVVEKHFGGSVSCSSTPGKGTVFTILLPWTGEKRS